LKVYFKCEGWVMMSQLRGLQGRIFKRTHSRYYWMAYYVNGREHRESTRCTDREAATVRLHQRLEASRRDIDLNELLDGLLQDYRLHNRVSMATVSYRLTHLHRLFAVSPSETYTASARWYSAKRLEKGAKPATINRELAALRRSLRLAFQDGKLYEVPYIPMLRENNVRRGFVEPADIDCLIAHLPEYLQDLTRFGYLSVWRRGEITSLTWVMIHLRQRLIILPTSKNQHGRVLALEGDLWELIERRDAQRGPLPWVFHRQGQRILTFRKAWAAACEAAGLQGRHFHDLRRSAPRNLIRAGVTDRVAMDFIGHKTRSMLDRYNITSLDDLRLAARRLQGYLDAVRKIWILVTAKEVDTCNNNFVKAQG
jgi:integrase